MTLAPSPRNVPDLAAPAELQPLISDNVQLDDLAGYNTFSNNKSAENYVVDTPAAAATNTAQTEDTDTVTVNVSDLKQLLARVDSLEQRVTESEQHNKYISTENDRLTIQLNKIDNLYKVTGTVMQMINTLATTMQKLQLELIAVDSKVSSSTATVQNNVQQTLDNVVQRVNEPQQHEVPNRVVTPLYNDTATGTVQIDGSKYNYPHPSADKSAQRDANVHLTQQPHYSQAYDMTRSAIRLQDIGAIKPQFSSVPVKATSNARNTNSTSMNVNNTLGSKTSVKLFPKYSAGNTMKYILTDEGMGIG